MPQEYDYIHCGNCGSIMRDWSKSTEVAGDYTPNDAREVDKSVDIMHEDMVLLAHILTTMQHHAANQSFEDMLQDAGNALIRLEEGLQGFAQYGGTFNEDQGKVVPESEIPKLADVEWSDAEDSEAPAIILDPRHAAIAYDYLSDHLRILLTGESYQVRARWRTDEEKAMRTILKALDDSRFEVDTRGRLAHPAGMPAVYPYNGALKPNVDKLYATFAFDDASDVGAGKILKHGAKLLKTIAKLSSQGEKVVVSVVVRKQEDSRGQ